MNPWDEIQQRCPRLYRNEIFFECGIGWANIISDLSDKIERILEKKDDEREMFAVQVKEKYGTLRFYMSCETDEIFDLIRDTEALSSQTCEVCGRHAKMRHTRWIRWIEVRCDECYNDKKP